MSKFQSTISVVAALASIFGAGAAGWKLAQDSNVKPVEEVNTKYEEHITQLQEKISSLEQQTKTVNPPAPAELPQPVVVKQVAPQPAALPAPPVVPPTPPTAPAPTPQEQ